MEKKIFKMRALIFLKNNINRQSLYLLFFILLFKIIFGFYLESFNPDFFITPDTFRYIDAAREICNTGKFNDINKMPETLRTPGLSILLLPAVCFDMNLKIYIIFLNSISILLAAYFTFKIIRLINIKINFLFVFLIFLFDPTLFRYNYNILSDIVFLFWFTLAIYFFIKGIKNTNFYFFFLGFVIFTLSSFIRPITFYLPYFLIICFILIYSLNSSFRSKFKFSLLLISLLGLIVHSFLTQLWIDRNYKLTGLREFSFIQSMNSYYYLSAGIVAKNQKKNFEEVKKDFLIKTKNFSDPKLAEYSKTELKNNIIRYPIETILVGLEGAMMTFFTPGTGQYAKMLNISQNNYKIAETIFNFIGFIWILIMSLLTIFGVVKINKNILFISLTLIFVYLVLVSSGPGSYSRFRIPFIPIIVVFIACGFENLLKLIKNSR